METKLLDGKLFTAMVGEGAACLNQNRTIVNDLNVFPIPDGDTGDNMYMTIHEGAAAAAKEPSLSLDEVASRTARGMLLGARGNSGVILSRIFAGIAKGLLGLEAVDVRAFGAALSAGVEESYRAVSNPVEGTILTVYRDAVNVANKKIGDDQTLETYLDNFIAELEASLDRTPELLPVLKEAGVVDSGGAGFVYIAKGMKAALLGEISEQEEAPVTTKAIDTSAFDENSVLEFGYCTEFLLQLQTAKVDPATFDEREIIDWLNSIGESVVAFREGTILKVHVHTKTPGEILSHCQKYGEFLTLKIENMTLQHHESTVQNNYRPERRRPHKRFATVAVAAGKGISDTFLSIGVDEVVNGGQSMNPSSEDFIAAFEKIDADVIFVFPNNRNILLAANQAATLYEKAAVRVINSTTIGEGYAALSMFDTDSGDVDTIVEMAEEVIRGVVTGMVSRAIRDTEKDGVNVHCGDYLGFTGKTMLVSDPVREASAVSLAEKLSAENYDILILLCGADADREEAERIYRTLTEKYRRTEVIMLDGGQPVYDYIMILE